MKVLFVSPVGGLGGAERCLLTAMAAVKRAGHDVHLISCTDGPLLAKAAELSIPARVVVMPASMAATGESGGMLRAMFRAPLLLCSTWNYARALRRAIAEVAPDVIHSNGLKTHVLLSAAKPNAKIVWHLHDFIGSRRLMGRLLRRASNRASRAIAISHAVKQDATGVLPNLPIDVVMNAIDVERFSPVPGRLHELPGDPDVLRVGLVATYARWKGQDLFLRAAARVLRERPELKVRFYIIGGAIYHTNGSQWSAEELDALARELGITEHVVRVPFQQETANVYRSLDVIVHASTKPEPFGLTIVEAMACGRPVIVANAGGAMEIFKDGHDALGFTPGEEAGLAARIVTLLEDFAEGIRLAENARQTVVRRFSDERLGGELMAVYAHARGS